MLGDQQCYATIPTTDVDRLRPFYEGVLGLSPMRVLPLGVYYAAGKGTFFLLTRSAGAASGAHTQLAFRVDDIEREVGDLRARGVVFEEYDLPAFKTEGGIARLPAGRAAWFRDPDRNLIGVFELSD
jgi:catechol 2,3-dioxygenase-like lactoylglutathione lyase family enzyme